MMRLTDSAFDPPHTQRWFVWGMPLSGKTSLGKKLKKILPVVFDLDKELEKRLQKTIPEIFAQSGEAYFREEETRLLREIVETYPQFLVITGGGTPCFHRNDGWMLANGTCLFMHTPLSVIITRAQTVVAGRPLLQGNAEERLTELYRQRLPVYETAHAEFVSEADAVRFFNLRMG